MRIVQAPLYMPIWEEQQKQKTIKGIVLFPKTEAGIKNKKKTCKTNMQGPYKREEKYCV